MGMHDYYDDDFKDTEDDKWDIMNHKEIIYCQECEFCRKYITPNMPFGSSLKDNYKCYEQSNIIIDKNENYVDKWFAPPEIIIQFIKKPFEINKNNDCSNFKQKSLIEPKKENGCKCQQHTK